MYWQELNDKRINQLKEWLQYKSIIVIGNSIKMMQYDYGKLIDSYDVVVRLGKGLPDEPLYPLLGSKTSIWFSGMLRAGLYNKANCKWKILTPSTKAIYDRDIFIPINKALLSEDFQPYRHYFWSDSLEETANYWSTLGFNKDNRPSQGIICCDFLARRVGVSFDVLGFDFFTEVINVNGKDYTSWHLPLKVGAVSDHAHSAVIEKDVMKKMIDNNGVRLLPYRD